MKKILCLGFVLLMLCSLCLPVSALDVYDSIDEYYDHEETGLTLPYRLVLPEVYDERYVFPMVVFLHGAGERGVDNRRQLDNCIQQIADNMPKAIILVPQCAHDNRWVDVDWIEGRYSVDEIEESDEMMAVMDLVAEIKQTYSVDANRVYAAGISMGGYGVWDAMIRHNDVFAAGIAVCGGGDPTKAELLKDTPMFVFHGSHDETVPPKGSLDMVQAIEAAGGTLVQYTEFAGAGHGIWGNVFAMEKLYKDLQKCELSDRYVPEEPEAEFPMQYVIIGAAAVVVVLALVVVLVILRKKKKAN